jgi:hypothetical protein
VNRPWASHHPFFRIIASYHLSSTLAIVNLRTLTIGTPVSIRARLDPLTGERPHDVSFYQRFTDHYRSPSPISNRPKTTCRDLDSLSFSVTVTITPIQGSRRLAFCSATFSLTSDNLQHMSDKVCILAQRAFYPFYVPCHAFCDSSLKGS